MSIKEKPLIDAVSRLGALPGFLFANPVFTGFFAMLMCPVFGGVFMMFWSLFGRGAEIFEVVRLGAIGATAFACLIFIGIFISALFSTDEKAYRLQFVSGALLGLLLLIGLDFLTVDILREYFGQGGFLICTSHVLGCD